MTSIPGDGRRDAIRERGRRPQLAVCVEQVPRVRIRHGRQLEQNAIARHVTATSAGGQRLFDSRRNLRKP
jgi:hypothetical protein